MLDDLRRHLRVLRRDPDVALAADEQHRRMEGLAVGEREVVDEQPLALLDAVLLAAD